MGFVNWAESLLFGPGYLSSNTTAQSVLLDAAGERFGAIFYPPKTGNIASVQFKTGTVTTGDTMLGSLQDLSTGDGYPDGTADQSGTVVIADGDDNAYKRVTFGSPRAVTRGDDPIAFVLEFNSYVAGNLNIVCTQGGNGQGTAGPVRADVIQYTGGAWAAVSRQPILTITYDDGLSYPCRGIYPGVPGSIAWNTGSGQIERGIYFYVPQTCQCDGVEFLMFPGGIVQFPKVHLYDQDGTTKLVTRTPDARRYINTTATRQCAVYWVAVTLTPGWYRLVLEATTATNITLFTLDGNANADLGMIPGTGTRGYLTQGSSGSWTETDTRRPAILPLLTGIDMGQAFVHTRKIFVPAQVRVRQRRPMIAGGSVTLQNIIVQRRRRII